jgi:K+-sensing histidine kinase KdpD
LQQAASDTTSFLHDVRTSLSIVLSSCERLIAARKGASFAEKLRAADPDLFRLYQAIDLLTQQLGLADLLSNPDSVAFGPKSSSEIYPFFYRMVKLFEPRAWERGVEIRLEGNCYENVELYNSFQMVPVVLLDNAVKYANSHSKICVKFDPRQDGLYVEFASFGPVVPPGYECAIFNKRVRGPNVGGRSSEGSGLGLHIASLVTGAHGFDISYEAREVYQGEGWNCFTLFIDSRFLTS